MTAMYHLSLQIVDTLFHQKYRNPAGQLQESLWLMTVEDDPSV